MQYRLWSYQGTTPSRVYPAADPRAQQAIANIALQLYRQDVWDGAARSVAQQWGDAWLHGFLAVMTDPPPPPQDGSFEGFYWVYRCQVAAALVQYASNQPEGAQRTAAGIASAIRLRARTITDAMPAVEQWIARRGSTARQGR